MNATPNEEKEKTVRQKYTAFWATVRYELLWNIRKKKVLGMVIITVALVVLISVLPPILANVTHTTIPPNPNEVLTSSIPGFFLFLFALVTVMNSFSGEFESGTIVPLLTKPISRTTVFLGKITAAVITFSPIYILLYLIVTIGGILVYGPQNDLYVVPLLFLGSVVSTLVWMSLVVAIGSVSKSSLFSALGPFLIYIGLLIGSGIVSAFPSQAWILTYLPGNGNSGALAVSSNAVASLQNATIISSGTDGIANTFVNFVLHPSYYVAFSNGTGTSVEPLSTVLGTAIGLAFAYAFVFLLIGWFALRQAQISE